ncbi:hypothetical protein AUP74_02437 [Microbulbifer aggregans]|uniref:Uncharacterized protein n=1 Tax=Microbulbifer aggregans TaxID=1769779 RepID=A0A1C9W9J8_9GAMM|nr:hypothetical protein [Microbulbifer aggregans]AOS97839.1 hypothetical protein AUP74_02437 [Microbulbifer aggregans]
MDANVAKLVATDKLQDWGEVASEIKGRNRSKTFQVAAPLWIKRMVNEGKLLLNPSIIAQLREQEWIPTELQKQMIWASIVCKLDSPEQRQEKARIRSLIQKRYDNEWWEEVYERAGRVWPAWDRYKKNILSVGTATATLAAHSSVLGQAFNREFEAILKMVPAL